MADVLIGKAEIAAELGRSRITVTRLMRRDPTFPKPVLLNGALRWSRAEFDTWRSRLLERRVDGGEMPPQFRPSTP
jgi:predicted DNA-binding transcriptional regulator AlpA